MALTARLSQAPTLLPINTESGHYKWLVAAIVLIAEGTNTFAGNSINLAVPRLMAHSGTDLAETQRVSTSLRIARTLVVPVLGWLGGMLGNRNLFVAMMVGFLIPTDGCLPLVYITVLWLIGRKRGAKPLIVGAARP